MVTLAKGPGVFIVVDKAWLLLLWLDKVRLCTLRCVYAPPGVICTSVMFCLLSK